MIHRLATLAGRLNRNREILFDLRLSSKIREPLRPKRSLKLPLAFLQRRRRYALFTH
jgi:hypothetical protein